MATELIDAVLKNDLPAVQRLLPLLSAAQINARSRVTGRNALHEACFAQGGSRDIANALLTAGADTCKPTFMGMQAPLHLATT